MVGESLSRAVVVDLGVNALRLGSPIENHVERKLAVDHLPPHEETLTVV
jgi:hypothetical protein